VCKVLSQHIVLEAVSSADLLQEEAVSGIGKKGDERSMTWEDSSVTKGPAQDTVLDYRLAPIAQAIQQP
jgi:hypothetical protein